MKFKKNRKKLLIQRNHAILIILITLCFNVGCENLITGPGPQPKFIENQDHEPLLNIFGVLRPDKLSDFPKSFIHLEKSFSALEEYPDSLEIEDANVTIFTLEKSSAVDSFRLNYTKFNSIFSKFEYRHKDLNPLPGKTYKICCKYEGYPELTSKTTIPYKPNILDESVENSQLTLTIERDSFSQLYEIYFIVGQNIYYERILRPEAGNISVKMKIEKSGESQGYLMIYAYDLNLSEYKTYTVTIKPNTYQANYSTVTNGFGCFGSMNFLEKTISF